MSRNVISPRDLAEGAVWTFVHSDGRQTRYEYEKRIAAAGPATDKHPGYDAMHALLNPATGKCAQVTEKWLREGPITSGSSPTGFGSHWLLGDVAAEMAA